MPGALRSGAALADPPLWAVTLTVMLGLLMAIIDTSIVNVALPTIGGNLGSTSDEIAWVATGYILANVIVMPLNGYLTAALGRKRYYAGCLVIFTVASLLCGTAHTTVELVFWRVIQGLGGGALQPTAQSILFESYPEEKRGTAMAIFGMGAMVGPAIGPTLGGIIVDDGSWPLIFLINVPIGIAAFFMTLAFIRDPSYVVKPTRGLDYVGLSLMVVGLSTMQYVLERGQRDDWFSASEIVVCSIVAVAALSTFVVREWRDPEAFVRLRVFRKLSFSAGNVIGVVSGFGLYGLNLVLPQFLQGILGFSPTLTGIALLPGAIATAISMVLAPLATRIVGPRGSIAGGLALFAIGAWWMGGLNQSSGFDEIFWPRVVQGLALGFLFVPLTTVTLAGISRADLPGATGLYTLVRQLGGSLGIAILELVEVRREAYAQTIFAGSTTLANGAVRHLLGPTGAANGARLAQIDGLVRQNAAMVAYDYLFRLCAVVFVISIPLVLLLRAPKPSEAAPVPLGE